MSDVNIAHKFGRKRAHGKKKMFTDKTNRDNICSSHDMATCYDYILSHVIILTHVMIRMWSYWLWATCSWSTSNRLRRWSLFYNDGMVIFFSQGTIDIDVFFNGFTIPCPSPLNVYLQINHWNRWFFDGFSQIQVRWSAMVLTLKKT